MNLTKLLGITMCFLVFHISNAQEKLTYENINYYNDIDAKGTKCRECLLDIYIPEGKSSFPVVVWFHGGGLTVGDKKIPDMLKGRGVAIVSANYRLSPNVKAPVYIEDAAAAVAWTFKNIKKYGGDPQQIYISGHSAGGYLSAMIGLDEHYLKKYNISTKEIAGLIPFSGQMITHFTIRQEQGIGALQPTIDQYAPIHFLKKDSPRILLFTGDKEKELFGRYEENAYMHRMMKLNGHQDILLYELQGYNHNNMVEPGIPLMINWIFKKD